eukprot:767142-Hanusia_phi.AAC.1
MRREVHASQDRFPNVERTGELNKESRCGQEAVQKAVRQDRKCPSEVKTRKLIEPFKEMYALRKVWMVSNE